MEGPTTCRATCRYGSASCRATVSRWHLLWYWKGYQPVSPINNMVMTFAGGQSCCDTKVPSAATVRGQNKNCMYHGSTGTYVTWSTIYGAGMWLILRQCALCGKSHDGLGTSLGGLGPPAGAATISGICWVYGGVLHCIWTPFGLLHPYCDLLSESGCLGGVCGML